MAQERDWSVYLAEKLDLPWTSDRVAATLKADVIKQVESKWSVMEPHVKLRAMLAVLGIKRADKQEELWAAFSSLVNAATQDTDEWVSVIALIIKGITPDGGSSDTTHSVYAECCQEIRKQLAALPPDALSDLPPLDSLYLPSTQEDEDGGPQSRNPHFVDRAPFIATDYGLGSISQEAAATDATHDPATTLKKVTGPVLSQPRVGLTKLSTPKSRAEASGGMWGSGGGGGGGVAGHDRKVVVEEADEDEGGYEDTSGGGKRRRGAGYMNLGEPKPKKGKQAAQHAVPAYRGEEDDEDVDEGNNGPAPFSEGPETHFQPAYGDAGGSPPGSEPPVNPWTTYQPPPAAALPPKPEGMNEWKDKLKSIQGLIELVKTSALSRGEITAIVDFIQGNKINPFADGVSERKYIIREEVHGSMTTSLSFVMNYGDGKWSVKKNNVKS